MEKWIKAGVAFNFISAAIAIWAQFFPKPASQGGIHMGHYLPSLFALLSSVVLVCGILIYKDIWPFGRKAVVTDEKAATRAASHASSLPTQQFVVPIIGLTLHDAVVEPLKPGLGYPLKLRLYFSNDGDEIHLGVGKWNAEGMGIQKGKSSACQYELKDHLGKWSGEAPDKLVPSGKWVRLYVGLDSTVAEDKAQQMKADHTLGVLQIPAIVAGVNVVLKMRP